MIIKHGTYRMALIFDSFVIKIAKVHALLAIIKLISWAKKGRLRQNFSLSFGSFNGPREWLVKGILENWHEFSFCIFEDNRFIMPTYFSFFGLFNIQKRGSLSKISLRDLDRLFLPILGKKFYRSHHWSNPDNFVLDEFGHITMCDYGSPKTKQEVSCHVDELCLTIIT